MGCVHGGGGVHHSIAYLFYLWFGPILTHFFKMTELYLVALVVMSWSTEKDSKQRKRNYCYAKTAVLLKGCLLLEGHLLAGW